MLVSLSISDIVLIERLRVDLTPGLGALTGETGAGKSILLDSLGLATGSRADKGLVRHGCTEGTATAVFDLPKSHPALARLSEAGIDDNGGQLILRRVQKADGPSRAFINDAPISVGLLQEVGSLIVEVHGQHEATGLLDVATHRNLLDTFGGLSRDAAATALAWQAWQAAKDALESYITQRTRDEDNADYLEHIIAELDELAVEPGEEEELAARRAHLMAAEKISDELRDAAKDLFSGNGFDAKVAKALKRLERIAPQAAGALDAAVEALSRVLDEAAEAERHVQAAVDELVFDAGELEQSEERLFALRAAARKHRVAVDALPAFLEDARARLQAVQSAESREADLEAAVAKARATYDDVAAQLSAKRALAATRLDKAVAAELKPLKLDKAKFKTHITSLAEGKEGPGGIDRVRFEIATNPGAPFGPLTDVASGGELSRFTLAIKVALADTGAATTLIFDEIDQGVGGAVAAAIGERLASLASKADAQVLVVTHSPQVAARADTHWKISKSLQKGAAVTAVNRLDADAREEEVARMLSGAAVTDEARAAARRLLDIPARAAQTA